MIGRIDGLVVDGCTPANAILLVVGPSVCLHTEASADLVWVGSIKWYRAENC